MSMNHPRASHADLLLIDDSITDLRVLLDFLALRALRISVATQGERGYEQSVALQPGLILLDIHMPDMDGIEAAKEIRKIRPGTPIVALSADSTVQDECLRAGMRAFLRKPLKVSDIKDLLVTLKIDVCPST